MNNKLGVSVKLRNELDDYDYWHKLNKEEQTFLYSFHREWVNADFNHRNKRIHTRKKDRIGIYNMNNSRNRDLYIISKCTGKLFFGDSVMENGGINTKYFQLYNKKVNPALQDEYYEPPKKRKRKK